MGEAAMLVLFPSHLCCFLLVHSISLGSQYWLAVLFVYLTSKLMVRLHFNGKVLLGITLAPSIPCHMVEDVVRAEKGNFTPEFLVPNIWA